MKRDPAHRHVPRYAPTVNVYDEATVIRMSADLRNSNTVSVVPPTQPTIILPDLAIPTLEPDVSLTDVPETQEVPPTETVIPPTEPVTTQRDTLPPMLQDVHADLA